jgi:hypothetical protein
MKNYYLRGFGRIKQGSPLRMPTGSPRRERKAVEITVEKPTPKRVALPKTQKKSGRFPFEFVHNNETDQLYPEKFFYSQKVDLGGDKSK